MLIRGCSLRQPKCSWKEQIPLKGNAIDALTGRPLLMLYNIGGPLTNTLRRPPMQNFNSFWSLSDFEMKPWHLQCFRPCRFSAKSRSQKDYFSTHEQRHFHANRARTGQKRYRTRCTPLKRDRKLFLRSPRNYEHPERDRNEIQICKGLRYSGFKWFCSCSVIIFVFFLVPNYLGIF